MRPSGACEEGGFPHAAVVGAPVPGSGLPGVAGGHAGIPAVAGVLRAVHPVFDVYEIPWDISAPATAAQLSRAEIAPLLDALDTARVGFRGFEGGVPQEERQRLFSLSFFRETEQGQDVRTAHFFLRSDGALYSSSQLYGYARYQLTGFDGDAFAAPWDGLPGLVPVGQEGFS